MADVLKHLIHTEGNRVYDAWGPQSAMYVTDTTHKFEVGYGRRHRLELRSAMEYVINDSYTGDMHPAHEHARRRLVHHLYSQQIDIGHKMLDALYGGASRDDVRKLVDNLLESMRE